ncbi:MAG: YidB family protein [Halioglobus sp.]|jgi:uncharacterized protein YidB (DUF937 family)
MDLLELGAKLLSQQANVAAENDTMKSALASVLGDGQGLDLAGVASKMAQSGELKSLLDSWLGDGANAAISSDTVRNLLGDGSVADFASKLGIDQDRAAQTLSAVLPQIMDKASSGGSLRDSAGGLSGLMNAAKSFLS